MTETDVLDLLHQRRMVLALRAAAAARLEQENTEEDGTADPEAGNDLAGEIAAYDCVLLELEEQLRPALN